MMYDFFLNYGKCSENFKTFEDFADACKKRDSACSIDYDCKSVTFYNYYYFDDRRMGFILDSLNDKDSYKKICKNNVECQMAFRRAMAGW